MTQHWRSDLLGRLWFLTVGAEVLIRAVWTLLLPIAGVRDVDAAAVVTLELIVGAVTRAPWAQAQTPSATPTGHERRTAKRSQISSLTFRLLFRRQHGDGDVVGALLAPRVRHSQLKVVNPLLETADLQQPWMSGLQTSKSQKMIL